MTYKGRPVVKFQSYQGQTEKLIFHSVRWYMQSYKWVNEAAWGSKVKVIPWPCPNLHTFQNSNCFSSETACLFEFKFLWKAYNSKKIKKYSNDSGHMTMMANMAIYDKKNLQSSSPEPVGWYPLNLVC